MRSRPITAVVVACLFAAPTATVSLSVAPDEAAAAGGHDRLERSIVRQINKVRKDAGVRSLRSSRPLNKAATSHSRSQLRRGVLTHSGLSQRVRRHTRARSVGETVVWAPGRARAARIVQMWMSSPSHRSQLLAGGYRRVGVGQRKGRLSGQRGRMVTAIFAGR